MTNNIQVKWTNKPKHIASILATKKKTHAIMGFIWNNYEAHKNSGPNIILKEVVWQKDKFVCWSKSLIYTHKEETNPNI